MQPILTRPFQRGDRERVTALVNAHIDAVLPGVSVSVNAVMSQLEREPGEYIVDPWVHERATLVAIERERVVAAAHLLRYASEERVSESYRNLGEIRWLVFEPDNARAGDALLGACISQFEGLGRRAPGRRGVAPLRLLLRRTRQLAAPAGAARARRLPQRGPHGGDPRRAGRRPHTRRGAARRGPDAPSRDARLHAVERPPRR